MNMPDEFTVPQAASYLKCERGDGPQKHQVKAPEGVKERYAMVHSTRCACGIRQQLRPEDGPGTTVALMLGEDAPASIAGGASQIDETD